jgi:hypothetical protein
MSTNFFIAVYNRKSPSPDNFTNISKNLARKDFKPTKSVVKLVSTVFIYYTGLGLSIIIELIIASGSIYIFSK